MSSSQPSRPSLTKRPSTRTIDKKPEIKKEPEKVAEKINALYNKFRKFY